MKYLLNLIVLIACMISACNSDATSNANRSTTSSGSATTSANNQSNLPSKAALADLNIDPKRFMANSSLEKLFPEIEGMTIKEKTNTPLGSMGVSLGNARATYKVDSTEFNCNVLDTAGEPLAVQMLFDQSATKDENTDKRMIKNTTFLDNPATEYEFKQVNSSRISILVDNRYIVTVRGLKCTLAQTEALAKKLNYSILSK